MLLSAVVFAGRSITSMGPNLVTTDGREWKSEHGRAHVHECMQATSPVPAMPTGLPVTMRDASPRHDPGRGSWHDSPRTGPDHGSWHDSPRTDPWLRHLASRPTVSTANVIERGPSTDRCDLRRGTVACPDAGSAKIVRTACGHDDPPSPAGSLATNAMACDRSKNERAAAFQTERARDCYLK